MRAHACAPESCAVGDRVGFVKRPGGGITDMFGTTGLALARARAPRPMRR
jgi:NTE family protein